MSTARFLRIGLVRDGQVLEERLVGMGSDVTVGRDAGNTFVVAGGRVPRSMVVFKARGADRHELMFDVPEGRVELGTGEPSTLAELVASGLAVRKDRGFVLPLPAGARGKLEIGDVSLLFHYLQRDLTLGRARAANKKAARPMTLEATLSWEGTVLAAKSFQPLCEVMLGPVPECDLQLPGRVLEHRAYPIVAGSDGRFAVDLRSPHVRITSLESAARTGDGARVMRREDDFTGDRYPIKGPFRMELALREGFALELRYAPALARPASSPFDIQDPQPIACLAGSALLHALIMVIAFAVGQSLLSADEVKAAKVERRRELHTMLQEQKVEAKAEADKQAEAEADKQEADKPSDEAKPEPEPARPRREAPRREVADAGSATPEARRTKLREGVRQKTFLNVLGGEGQEGDGALPVGRETQYADAFSDVEAPYAANGATDGLAPPGPAEGGEGGPAYKTLSKEDRGGDGIETRTVSTEDKGAAQEAAVKANVRTGSLGEEGGLGRIDNNAVAAVFSRRKGAIKACYEKELRRNADLKGRITLRFTIGTSGRITSISVSQNTTGDDAIASCIIDKVQSWKFDPPSGGAVTFTYPFILEAR